MEINVKKITGLDELRVACESTFLGKSYMSLEKIYKCQHSPIRTQNFWVEMKAIPTFVSVHLVRHKIGVEHFVLSMRDDRGNDKKMGVTVADRNTPINHSMFLNADALISMAKKRLCGQAHQEAQDVMKEIRRGVEKVDPNLARFMMPECFTRNMYCPEIKPCGKYKVSTELPFYDYT